MAEQSIAHPEGWRDAEPIAAFERAFARWVGAKAASSFLGGRVALSAAITALDLRPGDEVVVPGYTCVVVPNAFEFAGIRVRFADIELDSFGLQADALRATMTKRTRAVLVHHLYGLVARDYEECVEIARAQGAAVIEDCAQASGAQWKGRPVGLLGDVAIHSLEKTKVLTTVFGGLATTRDGPLSERLRAVQEGSAWPSDEVTRQILGNVQPLRDAVKGRPATPGIDRWVSTTPGEEQGQRPASYGARLPAPLARIGAVQLAKVEAFNARRRRKARLWDAWARKNGLAPPIPVDGGVPVFLRYPILMDPAMKRDLTWARPMGVRPGVWFLGTRHPVPGVAPGCPNAAKAVERCVNLPTLW